MAADFHMDPKSMRNLVIKDLGPKSKSFKQIKSTRSLLFKNERDPKARTTANADSQFPVQKMCFFSDEKFFTMEAFQYRRNDRILSPNVSSFPGDIRYAERTQKADSVMVWAGVTSEFRTKLVFVPLGAKTNKEQYNGLILDDVVKPFGHFKFRNEHWTFQQDGAPAHTASVNKAWCRSELPDFFLDEWPPSSPDP